MLHAVHYGLHKQTARLTNACERGLSTSGRRALQSTPRVAIEHEVGDEVSARVVRDLAGIWRPGHVRSALCNHQGGGTLAALDIRRDNFSWPRAALEQRGAVRKHRVGMLALVALPCAFVDFALFKRTFDIEFRCFGVLGHHDDFGKSAISHTQPQKT